MAEIDAQIDAQSTIEIDIGIRQVAARKYLAMQLVARPDRPAEMHLFRVHSEERLPRDASPLLVKRPLELEVNRAGRRIRVHVRAQSLAHLDRFDVVQRGRFEPW